MASKRLHHFRFCDRLERNTVCYDHNLKNVVKAFMSRVYVPRPAWAPHPEFKRVLDRAAFRLASQIGEELDAEGVSMVLQRFPPAKRALYAAGLETQLDLHRHSKVTMFTKCENVPLKEADKPRAIQFRTPPWVAHQLSCVKPFEHALFHGRYLWASNQKTTCAKGLTSLQRMDLLLKTVRRINDCHFISLDCSAFDAHVSPQALKAVSGFILRTLRAAGYAAKSVAKLRSMFSKMYKNRVVSYTDEGVVTCRVEGNVMSGDLWTSIVAVVLTCASLTATLTYLGIPEQDYGIVDDGDDACLFVSGKWIDLLKARLHDEMAKYGLDMRVENFSPVDDTNMEPIEFCQCHPVFVHPYGWRLIRDPMKVYNGYKMQNLWYRTRVESQRFWATIAPPEMIFASGVPILDSLFKMFHRLSGDQKPLDVIGRRFWLRACARLDGLVQPSPRVELLTRSSFEKAFPKFTLPEQVSIESELDSWHLEHLPEFPTDFQD